MQAKQAGEQEAQANVQTLGAMGEMVVGIAQTVDQLQQAIAQLQAQKPSKVVRLQKQPDGAWMAEIGQGNQE